MCGKLKLSKIEEASDSAQIVSTGTAVETTQGERPMPVRFIEGLYGKQALLMTCSAGYSWLSGP